MGKLVIHKGVHGYDLSPAVVEKIKKDLTMDNPLYAEAMRHGRFTVEPPILRFYKTQKSKNLIFFPKGYLYFVRKYMKSIGEECEIVDNTLKFDKLDINFSGSLRDYQEVALKAMLAYPNGVLEASTGAGKTVCGCAIIGARKQPTLILVHNKELLYQWEKAIKQFLNYDCGLIGDSKFTIRPISVGIINTVKNKMDVLADKFGQIIVDETHRAPGSMFMETIGLFPARYINGLSATPYRRDGLSNVIYMTVGPKLHKVDKEKLHESGAVLKPDIVRVDTKFRYYYRDDYQKMVMALTSDVNRNELIADKIIGDLKKCKENVLVVSDRVEHCKAISEILERRGYPSSLLHSKIPKKDRTKIVDRVKNGEVQILISTVSLIGEGFDAPNLSALFLCSPVRFSGRLLQVIGRVLRPSEGFKPRVYDFRDSEVGVLKGTGFQRDKVYKSQWG